MITCEGGYGNSNIVQIGKSLRAILHVLVGDIAVLLTIFISEQLRCHSFAFELLLDEMEVQHGKARRCWRNGIEHRF